MNDPIMLTPADIVHVLVAACAAIVTISTAVTLIIKWVTKLKEPEVKQDSKIKDIEDRLDDVERKLEVDKRRLDNIEYGHEVTQEALLALLNYSLNNDEVEGLKVAKKKLEGYLISARSEKI